jgi:hypothetical protein
METIMAAGEKVRLKASSREFDALKIPRDALGAVICRYRLLRGEATAQRLDVRFGPHIVLWGAPESLFEKVEEETRPS